MQITDAQFLRNSAGEVVGIRAVFNGQALTCPAVEGNGHYDAVMRAQKAGQVAIADPPAVIDSAILARAKDRLKIAIDAAAEQQRLRWITPGAAQSLVYSEKAAEAARAASDPAPTVQNYPLLAASRGSEQSIADVAAAVLQVRQQWLQIAAAIEAARLGGKTAVDAAMTLSAAKAAADAIVWPEEAAP